MNPFLQLSTMFGLGAAAGLDATLPPLLIGVLARTGVIALPAPFDALSQPAVLVGLAVLSLVSVLTGRTMRGATARVPAFAAMAERVSGPTTMMTGAVLAASQSGATDAHHLTVLTVVGGVLGAFVAAVVHALRAFSRALARAKFPGLHRIGTAIGKCEDGLALALTGLSLFSPVLSDYLVFVLLALAVIGVVVVVRTASGVVADFLERYGRQLPEPVQILLLRLYPRRAQRRADSAGGQRSPYARSAARPIGDHVQPPRAATDLSRLPPLPPPLPPPLRAPRAD